MLKIMRRLPRLPEIQEGLYSILKTNLILSGLPAADKHRIIPLLSTVKLELGDILYQPGDEISHLYFPQEGIISIVNTLSTGQTKEVMITGREGVVGVDLLLGVNTMQAQAVVLCSGEALKMAGDAVRREFGNSPVFRHRLLRYIHYLLLKTAQRAICNRHHTLEQQFCRWLLTMNDRLGSHEVKITQEIIANMLGVRREGITLAARRLQDRNIIAYQRGRIRILDREKLLQGACECYPVVSTEYRKFCTDIAGSPVGQP